MSRYPGIIGILLLTSLALANSPQESGQPFWSVPTVSTAPDTGDLLAGKGWDEGSALMGFTDFNSSYLSISQPVVWLGKSVDMFIVAWVMPLQPGKPPIADASQHDGPVWADDSFEVFLDPAHSHRDYLQFIVNSKGFIYDGKGKDGSWTSMAQVKTAVGENAWAGSLQIPLTELSPASEDNIWAANFVFDRTSAQRPVMGHKTESQILTWADIRDTLHQPGKFGHLLIDKPAMRLKQLGDLATGNLLVVAEISSGDLEVEVTPENGEAVKIPMSAIANPADTVKVVGDATLRVHGYTRENILASFTGKLRVLPDFQPEITALGMRQDLIISGVWNRPGKLGKAPMSVIITDRQAHQVASGILDFSKPDPEIKLSYASWNPDVYRIRYFTADGFEIVREKWLRPEKPVWMNSLAGIISDNQVLRPWEPLEIRGVNPLAIDCWGRTMTFGAAGMPAQVVSQGRDLFTRPANVNLSVAGKAYTLTGANAEIIKQAAGAVEFTQSEVQNGLKISTKARMEFDGFVRLDYEISAPKGPVTVDNLQFVMPFKKELATLTHFFAIKPVWTGFDMNDCNARGIPAEGLALPFTYHIWVGDEDGGLQWLCESAEVWKPADAKRAIELAPVDNTMELRFNVIGKPVRVDKPIRFSFALQASPVKPFPPDQFKNHYAQVASYGMESRPYPQGRADASVKYPAQGLINLQQGTIEMTVLPQFDADEKVPLNRSLFQLIWPKEKQEIPRDGLWLYWNLDDRGFRSVLRENDKYLLVAGAPVAAKKGEPLHVAMTWGDGISIYVNGKQTYHCDENLFLSQVTDLSEAMLKFGGNDSDFTLKQLRISNRILKLDELGKLGKPLQVTDETLLLDWFGNITGEDKTYRHSTPVFPSTNVMGTVTPTVSLTTDGLDFGGVTTTELETFRNWNIRWLGFHEQWSEWQGFPRTGQVDELKSLIKGVHDNDMHLLLYQAWQISDTAPEFKNYLKEIEIIHPSRFIYTREPKQVDYPVCPRSGWGDFMADGIAKLFAEYGHDGIYSDGVTYPTECMNKLHGCGWTDTEGVRHATFNLFAMRDAVKRFAAILEAQNKPTMFVGHTSGSITLPTLSFVDAYLDAEHLTPLPRPVRVPLDTFRAEFMGHNFGIPAYFLAYDWLHGPTSTEGLAMAVLHGAELPWSYNQMLPVWKVWDKFGISEAKFLPYWKPEGWFVSAPEGVKVSAWRNADGNMMVAVVNLNEEPVTGTVELAMPLGDISNALGGQKISNTDGKITDLFPTLTLKLYIATTR